MMTHPAHTSLPLRAPGRSRQSIGKYRDKPELIMPHRQLDTAPIRLVKKP